ncbi:hypothetical protein VSR01_28265 [Actinacidiphila sp. DG2A-62]|uniref:hypothetical protein n=1 Tax=Actinacidiphila sp. DG2A-62 TaxID=3108821 RepID=UPI002DBD7056|nr:hypothetical protein [Actinacidiphila sp. DG2A-62]MEC3997187.1 hypothetical protein [Actinacidiphila sp. DG2A-62]
MLSYAASLPLDTAESQLLCVVVAIRAARGGVGNVIGADLSALRLTDARGAVDALRALGWQIDAALLDGDPTTPLPITVPDLERETGHPLPFGKNVRSRVSGWTARVLSAKPVRKLPPAARLASLFLAAHSTSKLVGEIPSDLPDSCREALPNLKSSGFLAEFSTDGYLLDPAVRHLSGMRRPTEEERAVDPTGCPESSVTAAPPAFRFDADVWTEWKTAATPALQRHIETVERCTQCVLPQERVASAFMVPMRPQFFPKRIKEAYGEWKDAHPHRGPQAAEFTVAFRAAHGHGPSYAQLCSGLGWDVDRALRGLIVQLLLKNEWLTDTSPVPWTLRPGTAAHAQGIALPRARTSAAPPPAAVSEHAAIYAFSADSSERIDSFPRGEQTPEE